MRNGVFISYAHKDIDQVREVVEAIQAITDIPVWYDSNLRGGEQYFSVIAEQILKNDTFVFCVSEHSVSSPWCIQELEFAMSEGKRIIAIWLEDFTPPPRVKLVISNTHYILRYQISADELRRSLQDSLAGGSLVLGDQTAQSQDGMEELPAGEGRYFLTRKDRDQAARCLHLAQQGKFSACFTAENALLLGLAYELGLGVEADRKRAEFYYRVARHENHPDAEYLLRMLTGPDRDQETLARLDSLADQGSVYAMVYWGDQVYDGKDGRPADQGKAVRWWQAAADRHHPVAEYFMAFCCRAGVQREKDFALALMYALRSAEQGFPRAYRILGHIYRQGDFVAADPEQARVYYQKALDLGDTLSLNYLGDLRFDVKDYDGALTYYLQAVEAAEDGKTNSAVPYYDLAWAYEHGQGVREDMVKAITLYFKAAERGHRSSRRRVVSVIRDAREQLGDARTVTCYRRASDLDCESAEYYLGKHYEDRGDPAQAIAWFNTGADKGSMECLSQLFFYYPRAMGHYDYEDREKALECFRLFFSLWDSTEESDWKASVRESLIAVYYYAYAVELDIDETGGTPDREHALYYYRKSLNAPNGLQYLPRIAGVALGYVDPDSTGGVLFQDLSHGADICDLLLEHLAAYRADCESQADYEQAVQSLRQCYTRLLRQAAPTGRFGRKEPAGSQAERYRQALATIDGLPWED